MDIYFLSIAVITGSGFISLIATRNGKAATVIGASGAVAGCLLGLYSAINALLGGGFSYKGYWWAPFGSLALNVDSLSAFFMLPLFTVCGVAAVYGAGYLWHDAGKRRLGPPWFFFNLLVASMAVVTAAANGVLFLVAWEVMSIASFFLVMFDHHKPETRHAGFVYLVATHLGAAFIFALFAILASGAGSLDFADFQGGLTPWTATAIFILALIGFGSKAGVVPFHVWLPEAHPAAPSHVSAVMSGVMIKMGVYGIFRTLTFLGAPEIWWGGLLLGIGIVSGLFGVIMAMGQRDIKRLLAYSTVENAGIILLATGLGVMGVANGSATLSALGFAGAFFHIWNHSLFKSLLFMGAGAVLHETGEKNMEKLGGLIKRMPYTGALFIFGSVAICGLPPLNGFAGEFIIYLGAFHSLSAKTGLIVASAPVVAIAGLAVIGGLAVAVFVKAAGVVFLGEPRSSQAGQAHEPGLRMTGAMTALAALMGFTALFAPAFPRFIAGPVSMMTRQDMLISVETLEWAGQSLFSVNAGLILTLVIIAGVTLIRKAALGERNVRRAITWDCGYSAPTARMQYTGSSFSQPAADFFAITLRPSKKLDMKQTIFPEGASFSSSVSDVVDEKLYGGLFRQGEKLAIGAQKIKAIYANTYIFYTAGALIALLAWGFGVFQ
ncbi:MAG: hypothetical protein HY751_04185 [Nitrospinae bacterium]|nr:hypothetical protein [Nitrospinota bacterium]